MYPRGHGPRGSVITDKAIVACSGAPLVFQEDLPRHLFSKSVWCITDDIRPLQHIAKINVEVCNIHASAWNASLR